MKGSINLKQPNEMQYAASTASNESGSVMSEQYAMDKHQQYKLMNEMTKLTHRVNTISRSVDSMQKVVNGVDNRMNEVEKKTIVRHQNCTKSEKLIIRMITKLQNDVDGMKDEIEWIKQCWINTAQQQYEDDEDDADSY